MRTGEKIYICLVLCAKRGGSRLDRWIKLFPSESKTIDQKLLFSPFFPPAVFLRLLLFLFMILLYLFFPSFSLSFLFLIYPFTLRLSPSSFALGYVADYIQHYCTLVNCSGPLFCRKVCADSAWPISISMASGRLDWLKRMRVSKLAAALRRRWAAAFIGSNRELCRAVKKMELSQRVLADYK